ncbi:MAG: hypothetical protein GY940_10660 [bacterium]|nr:hypothetical protein [bacterium]
MGNISFNSDANTREDSYGRESGDFDVSFLENSIYYFVKCAFLKQEQDGCRLVVTHEDRLMLDRLYSTVKGAKIGFVKRYGDRVWQEGVRPLWTSSDGKPV